MTSIYYNGIDAFSGLAPTPFVGRDVTMIEFGDRWGQLETFKLNGTLTGGCSGFSGIIAKQDDLISRFSSDFKTFEIKDDSTSVFVRDAAKVEGISFGQSNYAYAVPFALTLLVYPSGYFSGVFGVLDPKNEYSYSETLGGVVSLTHAISAKGFNTSNGDSNSLSNAFSWVDGNRGLANLVLPAFIAYTNQTLCLTTIVETVNRITGAYEVRETYTTDLTQIGFGILRYTVDYDYNYDTGKSTVSVKGEIAGCKAGTINDLRTRYANFDAFQEALKVYRKITGLNDLNSTVLTKGVSEDVKRLRISFSYSFDNNLLPSTRFEYSVKFDYNLEDDTISAEIDGTITSNLLLADRWAAVQAYADSIDLYSLLLPIYNIYASGLGITYPLNPNYRSYSRTENSFVAEIKLTARWDNAVVPPLGFKTAELTVDITPSLEQFSASPCIDGLGSYRVRDLGYRTRQQAAFSISAIGVSTYTTSQVEQACKDQILAMYSQYAQGNRPYLEAQSIKDSNSAFGLAVTASATYTVEVPLFTIP